MPTAQFFVYKGHLGCLVDPDGKFLNDPTAPGQLGSVVSTEHVVMSQEAKDLIKKAKRGGGSFAPLMLTKHEGVGLQHGPSSIGILGGWKANFGTLDDFTIGRTCDLSALDDCTIGTVEAPDDYKTFIDSKVH